MIGSHSRTLFSDILPAFHGRSDEIRVRLLSFAESYSVAGGDKADAFLFSERKRYDVEGKHSIESFAKERNKAMKLQLIRHGEPDYEHDTLTSKGWREAELLADRLCREPADAYYVSPLGRAQDTARATLARLDRKAVTLPWLQEFRGKLTDPITGDQCIIWDLLPQYWTRYQPFYDKDKWLEAPILKTGDADEIYRETTEGLDALLASHGYHRDGMLYRTEENRRETIVLFCHFGIASMILSHILGVSPMVLLHGFLMPPTSVTTLVTEERVKGEVWFRCTGYADVSHLYCAGEAVSMSGQFGELYEDGFSREPIIQMETVPVRPFR